jgi:pimeloyl-ACP methyl ester carboxylesterase
MGGATALMAAGHHLPGDVAGVIADSAYTSMKDIVLESVRRRIRFFPVRTAVKVIESRCIGRAGFDLNGADAEKALRNCRIPVLLIHGTADRRVSADNSRRNHQACACADKELLIVENADHVCSWFEDPARYRSTLAAFFEKHDRQD